MTVKNYPATRVRNDVWVGLPELGRVAVVGRPTRSPSSHAKEMFVFYTDGKLQYRVRVDTPNPVFAKMLQQAIGGVEGGLQPAEGRWSRGRSIDGKGEFTTVS